MKTTSTSKHSTTKQVSVLAVYKFKKVSRICFTVLSSKGDQQYNCCFSNDAQHASCNCPATRECYHIDQLRSRAAEYFQAVNAERAERARAIAEARQRRLEAEAEVARIAAEAEALMAKTDAVRQPIAPRLQEDWDSPSGFSTEAERIERKAAAAELKSLCNQGALNGNRAFSLLR